MRKMYAVKRFFLVISIALFLQPGLKAVALTEFGVSCHGIDIWVFSYCWAYSWTGVCNDGPAVGGVSYDPQGCANGASAACENHQGLVASDSCPDGYELVDGICRKRFLMQPSGPVSVKAEKLEFNESIVDQSFCSSWARWACNGKCIKLSSPCGDICSEGRDKDQKGNCVVKE